MDSEFGKYNSRQDDSEIWRISVNWNILSLVCIVKGMPEYVQHSPNNPFCKFQKSQHLINGYLKIQTNYVIKYPTLASFLPAHAASPEVAFVCILDCVCVYFLNLFLHSYKQCMYNIIKIIVS